MAMLCAPRHTKPPCRFLKQAREPGSIMEEEYASSTSGNGGSSNARGSAGQRRSSQQLAAASAGGRTGGSGGNGSSSSSSGGGKRQRRSGGGAGEEQQRAAAGGGAKAGTFGAAVGLWRNLTNKLFDLEANIMVQVSGRRCSGRGSDPGGCWGGGGGRGHRPGVTTT